MHFWANPFFLGCILVWETFPRIRWLFCCLSLTLKCSTVCDFDTRFFTSLTHCSGKASLIFVSGAVLSLASCWIRLEFWPILTFSRDLFAFLSILLAASPFTHEFNFGLTGVTMWYLQWKLNLEPQLIVILEAGFFKVVFSRSRTSFTLSCPNFKRISLCKFIFPG